MSTASAGSAAQPEQQRQYDTWWRMGDCVYGSSGGVLYGAVDRGAGTQMHRMSIWTVGQFLTEFNHLISAPPPWYGDHSCWRVSEGL